MSGRTSQRKRTRADRQPVPGKVFANRSPILGLAKHIKAYQLDFLEIVRTENGRQPQKASDASTSSFLDTLNPRPLTSGRMAFVKIDAHDVNMFCGKTDWKGKIVLDLDLSASEGEDVSGLLKSLAGEKTTFCLSGVPLTEESKRLLPPGCFVKIDVRNRKEGELEAILSAFGKLPLQVIADSVDTWEDFKACSRLGFELFCGDFFRKPSALARNSISPNHALLLDLSTRAAHEEDIRTIEEIFKKNPDLAFGLFNLIRSAYFHVPKDVTSIKQAVTLLGYKNLQKWAALMLFNINHSDPSSNPLFENALVRAATMEHAASKLRKKGLSDAAYMTGILSLVPALFDVRLEAMVENANFGEEIGEALLKGAGPLGAMLAVVEALEKGAYEKCIEQAEQAGVSFESFLSAQASAYVECSTLTDARDQDKPVEEMSFRKTGQKSIPSPIAGHESSPKSWLKRVQSFFHLS